MNLLGPLCRRFLRASACQLTASLSARGRVRCADVCEIVSWKKFTASSRVLTFSCETASKQTL